jgi:superfamily I DNA and/or RNA helicase
MIVSLVRSASAGFPKDDRHTFMNVALTRAWYQLVFVDNVACYSLMEPVHTLNHLAADS